MGNTTDELSALRFTANAHWSVSLWAATTFQWHPSSDAPPIMGLVFVNVDAGHSIFREWVETCGNQDLDEDIRISIIEGNIPGQAPGYSVHICPEPDKPLATHAIARRMLFECIEVFYNRQRLHSALGYESPATCEQRHQVAS